MHDSILDTQRPSFRTDFPPTKKIGLGHHPTRAPLLSRRASRRYGCATSDRLLPQMEGEGHRNHVPFHDV